MKNGNESHLVCLDLNEINMVSGGSRIRRPESESTEFVPTHDEGAGGAGSGGSASGGSGSMAMTVTGGWASTVSGTKEIFRLNNKV